MPISLQLIVYKVLAQRDEMYMHVFNIHCVRVSQQVLFQQGRIMTLSDMLVWKSYSPWKDYQFGCKFHFS